MKLLAPVAHPGEAHEGAARVEGAIISPANNLEYTVLVPAGEKKEVSVKWQIDYPGNEKLDYNEKF